MERQHAHRLNHELLLLLLGSAQVETLHDFGLTLWLGICHAAMLFTCAQRWRPWSVRQAPTGARGHAKSEALSEADALSVRALDQRYG